MNVNAENPYLLLTPGPLSTASSVRQAMLRDWCTWDDDYNLGVVTPIREKLVRLASASKPEDFTAVLMQGSGTFSVEATIGTVIPAGGRLLVLANGEYGNRLARIAQRLQIDTVVHDSGELGAPDLTRLEVQLASDRDLTHVACVHVETTTGMLNPIESIARIVKEHRRKFLVDSMSGFGGIPMDIADLGIDYLISSANKCFQGVPGFGVVVARRDDLASCQGQARSVSLDLYDQWTAMEQCHGKWRFTSPTHTVRAFAQALADLEAEGGVPSRNRRYCENQRSLVAGMERLGFQCLLPHAQHSPIITGFHSPVHEGYQFGRFYQRLKDLGFVIYPGKVTGVDSFRIGTIGHVFPTDIDRLIQAVETAVDWNRSSP
jgi:2-aminoethylphosphonate-pyruvate transaminase